MGSALESSVGGGADARAVARGPQPWTHIIAHRRRDRLVILPLTMLAGFAAAIWLGPAFPALWLPATLVSFALSHLLGEWILRRREPSARWEAVMAAHGAVHAGLYCALPVALISGGPPTAALSGLTMMGAVAISAATEVVISPMIGGAALAGVFVAAMAAANARLGGLLSLRTVFAAIGMFCFLAYLIQSARARRALERGMAAALETAVLKEREAAQANAAKTTFLAMMSHEIRTPLNGVLGMAQAMAGDELSERQRARLAVIRTSGEALTTILNDVLDLSKIEAGQLEIEAIPFDLAQLLGMGRSTFANVAETKGLDLELDIDPAAEGSYLGDPTRLRQVVFNLISNALKFTVTGGVRVRADYADDRLRIAVSDTGPGIPAEQQGKLFARFVQLDASTTRRHGGTGLGLAICRELCDLMGGDIGMVSHPGEGATFTVSLPLPRIEAAPREVPTAEPAGQDGVAGRLVRILAAEDNEVNQLVLKALLDQEGLELHVVADGAQAVAAWADGHWDLVLMDVQMPVMDGITAVREIRGREAMEGLRRTPVVALTGNAMVHQIAELTAAGMDGHVSKPIEVSRLFAAVEAALALNAGTPGAGESPDVDDVQAAQV
ncbi:MAG: ATP-binding protein [Caulobacteraceae bacterium]|nr:ATP-binding protein [Caulobacteraceae bacterium]